MNETQLSELLHDTPAEAPAVDWAGEAVTIGRRRVRRRRALHTAAGVVVVAGVVTTAVHLQGDTSTLTTAEGDQVVASTPFEAKALDELRQIDAGDCEPTAAAFDAVVKARLDATSLCASYRDYTDAFGALVRPTKATQTERGDLAVVQVFLELRRAKGEYRVSFHPDGTIAGIYFLRSGVPLPR